MLSCILYRERVQQVKLLKHKAEIVAPEGRNVALLYLAKLLAVEHDRAAGRLVQRRKKIQKRRFARAGLAHYGDVLALIDAEVYVFKRLHLVSTKARAVYFSEIFNG